MAGKWHNEVVNIIVSNVYNYSQTLILLILLKTTYLAPRHLHA